MYLDKFNTIFNLCQSVRECLEMGREGKAIMDLDEIQRICCEVLNAKETI